MDSNFTNVPEQPVAQQPATEEKTGMSLASMILGLCGLVAWCLPLVGYPVTIVGLILGCIGRNKGGKGMATAGIILSIITLLFTLANSIAGIYLNTMGQMNF